MANQLSPPLVPDHELIRRIGGGSYGEVWLAKNAVGTLRTVKFVQRQTFEREEHFQREFKNGAAVARWPAGQKRTRKPRRSEPVEMFAPPHAGLISSRPVPDTEILAAEFDAPWKIGLELFLEPFLQFSFPAVHALINWREPPVFLDTELQQIAPAHEQGERSVDKLVRVRLRDGREEWLLIHVEIQAQRDQEFPARMWIYYYRIFDKFGQRIISLAVLADDQQDWRPHTYHTELGGCVQHFEFPVFKVIECADAVGEFERTGNPFALLVAAHQVALATRHDAPQRCQERFRLVRYLYRHGLERKQVLDLFRLIAWLTRLPENWELQFQEQLVKFEQSEPAMTKETLLSPLELILQRKFREEGREEASRLAVLDALEARFGAVPAEIQDKVQQMSDDARLRQALRLAVTAPTLQRFLENA